MSARRLQVYWVWVYLHSFSRCWLPSKCTKSREIPIKFDLIAVQGHPWSSISVSMESSFEWWHRWPPKTFPSPKMRFYMPPRYANGHISATGNPIHFMFPSRVVFLESADRMALFSGYSTSKLNNFELPYLRNDSFDPQRDTRGHLCDSTVFLYFYFFT